MGTHCVRPNNRNIASYAQEVWYGIHIAYRFYRGHGLGVHRSTDGYAWTVVRF